MSNTRHILQQLATGSITVDQAENLLYDANNRHFRMTERGAIAVLGIQRRALVLFPSQWRQLNNRMAQLMKYIDHNVSELKTRQDNYQATSQSTAATITTTTGTKTTSTGECCSCCIDGDCN